MPGKKASLELSQRMMNLPQMKIMKRRTAESPELNQKKMTA